MQCRSTGTNIKEKWKNTIKECVSCGMTFSGWLNCPVCGSSIVMELMIPKKQKKNGSSYK